MRRVLILGGTGWLGREIARSAVADGAEVTCLARGESGAEPDGVTLARADRRAPGAYDTLVGEWDEVIEISYAADLVESALEALADRAAHWTLVSSVSVYAHGDEPGADESAELVEPADATQYPDAKVLAERVTAAHVGDRLLLARPGLIVGAGDPSHRFGYWPERLARGGDVVVPTMSGRHVQVIDAIDLAAWIVRAGGAGLVGPVNAVGEVHPMRSFFDVLTRTTDFDGSLIEVDDETLLAHGVDYWAGPRSLPLWLPASEVGFATRDGSAYLASGGTLSPLADTVRRVLADGARAAEPRRAGLSAAEEAEILTAID